MKISASAIVGILSLTGAVAARPRVRTNDDPENMRSKVTAFVIGDNGLKVECWEIDDLIPDTSSTSEGGTVHRQTLANKLDDVEIFTFPPGTSLVGKSATGVRTNVFDNGDSKPTLLTVKDGIIMIQAEPPSGDGVGAKEDYSIPYVYNMENGDDWFYFEDGVPSYEPDPRQAKKDQCAKATDEGALTMSTASSSDTTLISFTYNSTPKHKVLHEGRCNFGGLTPSSKASRFRTQF